MPCRQNPIRRNLGTHFAQGPEKPEFGDRNNIDIMMRVPSRHTLACNLLMAVAYLASAWAAMALALPPDYVAAPMWPAAGLALAGALVFGDRILPGVLLGALVFNLYQHGEFGNGTDLALMLLVNTLVSISSTLQAWLGATLIRRAIGKHNPLLKDVVIIKFLLLGGPVSCLLAPTLAVSTLHLYGMISGADMPLQWLTWWVGDTIGVLIFAPLLLTLARPAAGIPARKRRIPLTSGLLFLLLLNILLIQFMNNKLSEREMLSLQHDSDLTTGLIRRKLEVDMEIIHALARFIQTTGNTSAGRFHHFTADNITRHPEIKALEWIPRVPDTQRNNFEYASGADFRITELDATGHLVTASQRPEYFPIQYLVPVRGNEAARGFDVYTNPVAGTAITKARESGLLTATAPTRLVQETGDQAGMVMYMPVYSGTGDQRELLGFAAGVFRTGDLIKNALSGMQPEEIWFRVYDRGKPRQTLYQSNGKPLNTPMRQVTEGTPLARHILVAGRDWQIDFSVAEDYASASTDWSTWLLFIGAGLVTAMFAALLLILTGREIRTTHLIDEQNAKLRQEIRQRHEIETALRISEQKYRGAFGQAPIPIAITDLNGNIIEANDQAAISIGYSREELLKMNIREITHPEDLRLSMDKLQQLVQGRISSYQIEKRYICKDGRILDTLLNTSVIRDGQGRPKYMIAQILDFTDRKNYERQLKKLSTAVEHSPSMIIITDPNGCIEYVNPKFCKITGHSKDEVLGRDVSLLASGLTPGAVYADLWSTLQTGLEWRGELENKRKDDTLFWASIDIAPIFDEDKAITQFVAIEEDITHARELSEQLSYQASHDPLTGLLNRQELERRLRRVLDTAHSDNSEHAFCFLDLDQFKVVNDTSGHIAGDELLRQLAAMLQGLLRKRDTLARLGGDEFAILMEHCNLDQAQGKANRIRSAISDFKFSWEDRSYTISASLGLVSINRYSKDLTEVMKQADTACYVAKDTGRNRIHTYHTDDQELSLHEGEIRWVSEINTALAQDRFKLYAQKIAPIHGQDEYPAYEILLRLQGSDGTLIAPGAFLPAAERYNLSTRIDRWVIDTAFHWLDEHASTIHFAHISINLSGHTLGDEAVLAHIIRIWNTTAVDPARVVFEITETAAIANLTAATRFINILKGHGFGFSLDDFGSGLSSFGYLKTLPVDYLKIDGMFVRDIADDPIDRAMVHAINEIGHVMDKQTVAEFVENDAILDLLREIGVDYAQGYGIGHPMPLDHLLHGA